MPRRNAVDILGIGAQKSATSWAAYALNLQPKVWIPQDKARSGKEVSFFDWHWDKGKNWYRRVMTPPSDDLKSMDVSPGYAMIGSRKIAVCKEMSPDARVFFLLRNPVDRDWSSLVMRAGRCNFDIASASFVDLMVFYDHENVERFSAYESAIQRWRTAYGAQLMLGLYDDICQDSHAFYRALCAHVGVAPNDAPTWESRIEKKVFVGPSVAIPAQMHEFLAKKYRPMVLRLRDLVERDLSTWLSIPGAHAIDAPKDNLVLVKGRG